jgi:aminobenzoyl-glutamate utilization protein A
MIGLTNAVYRLMEKVSELRRDFHQFTESGWVEYRTAAKVATLLTEWGYTVYAGPAACRSDSRMGVPDAQTLSSHERHALAEGADPHWVKGMGGHTAVIGVMRSLVPGPVAAFRFDMDSNVLQESDSAAHLPVAEGFRSAHDNRMHACGHDGHTAIGLGLAEVLAEMKGQWSGELRLIFQPAEEGFMGAKSIVDAGWLEQVDFFYSGHIGFKSFRLGEVAAAVGGFLPTVKIDAAFHGTPAHAGGSPELGKNALLAAASAALHLHGINRHM